jgi:hypothetical protein
MLLPGFARQAGRFDTARDSRVGKPCLRAVIAEPAISTLELAISGRELVISTRELIISTPEIRTYKELSPPCH